MTRLPSAKLELPSGLASSDSEAVAVLSRLPANAVSRLLAELRGWLQERRSRITSVHLHAVTEPEADNWTEAVFEVVVDAEADDAIALWDEIAARLHTVKQSLPEQERLAISKHVGVHLTWHTEA